MASSAPANAWPNLVPALRTANWLLALKASRTHMEGAVGGTADMRPLNAEWPAGQAVDAVGSRRILSCCRRVALHAVPNTRIFPVMHPSSRLPESPPAAPASQRTRSWWIPYKVAAYYLAFS